MKFLGPRRKADSRTSDQSSVLEERIEIAVVYFLNKDTQKKQEIVLFTNLSDFVFLDRMGHGSRIQQSPNTCTRCFSTSKPVVFMFDAMTGNPTFTLASEP